eukprot:877049-Pleurochrysis_carterae.AAC.4
MGLRVGLAGRPDRQKSCPSRTRSDRDDLRCQAAIPTRPNDLKTLTALVEHSNAYRHLHPQSNRSQAEMLHNSKQPARSMHVVVEIFVLVDISTLGRHLA